MGHQFVKSPAFSKQCQLKALAAGFIFHYIDTKGLLSAYKLHTPAEDLTKNRASKANVIKFALFQQICQCTLGYLTAAEEQFVSHEYAIATWAQMIRYIGDFAIQWTRYIGLDLPWIAHDSRGYGSAFPATFGQDTYSRSIGNLSQVVQPQTALVPMQFSAGETFIAKILYWILVPLFQYIAVMVLADTMQYFTHRAFHVNKWLYSKPKPTFCFMIIPANSLKEHIHSMHHDIYVPYAYGAFYNHPLETIPIDMIFFPMCLAIAQLDNRQAAIFGAIWTFKTVVDHCGYDFPYNPCNIVCPHSVLFHDLQYVHPLRAFI